MRILKAGDAGAVVGPTIAAGAVGVVLTTHTLIGHGAAFLIERTVAVVDAANAGALMADGLVAIGGGQTLDTLILLGIADLGTRALSVVDAADADVLLGIAKGRQGAGADAVVDALNTLIFAGADKALRAIDGHPTFAADRAIARCIADAVGAVVVAETGHAMARGLVADARVAIGAGGTGLDALLGVEIADESAFVALLVVGALPR